MPSKRLDLNAISRTTFLLLFDLISSTTLTQQLQAGIMEETRIFARPIGNGPKDALFTEIILLLRFVQQCSLVVALFISTYFVYWHLTLVDDVPKGLVVFIASVCAASSCEVSPANTALVRCYTSPPPDLDSFACPIS